LNPGTGPQTKKLQGASQKSRDGTVRS